MNASMLVLESTYDSKIYPTLNIYETQEIGILPFLIVPLSYYDNSEIFHDATHAIE